MTSIELKYIQIELISIGDELLSGLTVNTNASWLSRKLSEIGYNVRWITTISDHTGEIESALNRAGKRADIIICTGGLGPTPDDITKKAICSFFKTRLILHEETFNRMIELFRKRNIAMPPVNKNQAMLPESVQLITNPIGTAPGMIFQQNNHKYFFLPGVPREMKSIVDSFILKYLVENYDSPKLFTYLFRTTGIIESRLYEKLAPTLEKFDDFQVAFLPKSIGVNIRIKYRPTKENGSLLFEKFISEVRKCLGKYIYTEKDHELWAVIGEILQQRNLTLCVAESFTGGLISDWITDVPGSSQYFLGSIISYSNESKISELDVSAKTIDTYGAVSEETVRKMVVGIQNKFQSNCAIATTGIAGPTGATETKTIGLCYIAVLYDKQLVVKKFNFGRDRRTNKERGAIAGLEMLRRVLLSL
jgi:nicotinamide-nucleotide amidase